MTTKFYDAYSVFINSEELFNQMFQDYLLLLI